MHRGAPTLMINADAPDTLNPDVQRRAVGEWGGAVVVAVVQDQIQHIPAMPVVGETFISPSLRGCDLHQTIADPKR